MAEEAQALPIAAAETPAATDSATVQDTPDAAIPESSADPSGPVSESNAVSPTKPEEEPQNALTRKFTEAEWTALKAFRDRLPEIFLQAYPNNADAKSTPVKLWGVTMDPNSFTDARVSVILMKFLRARNLKVQDAETMLVATLRWREEFKLEEAVKAEYPEDVFGKVGHVYGHDTAGRPVTYNLYGAHLDLKSVFSDVQRFLRWRVSLMEKGISLLDFETVDQMVQVHDYEGASLSSRDANSKSAASEATRIFSDYYPELLYRKFFVNTLAKMTVVGSGPQTIGNVLLSVIAADQLPVRYGGKAEAF